jgi:hypothetical protein
MATPRQQLLIARAGLPGVAALLVTGKTGAELVSSVVA